MRFRSLAFWQPANVLKSLVTVGVASLGWAAGSAAVTRPVGACSCMAPEWSVRLVSATVDPSGDNHQKLWPTDAALDYSPGAVEIRLGFPAAGFVNRAWVGQ